MQVLTIIAFALVAKTSANDCDQHQKQNNLTRIVNGEEVVPHSMPWQAFIISFLEDISDLDDDLAENVICGGSIISNQWILTAAHCILDDFNSYYVILGAHDKSMIEDTQYRIRFTEYIIHEDYDDDLTPYDIALIKLPEPIAFTDYIQPIGLNTEDDVEGMEATIAGWGQQCNKPGRASDVLQSITVFVMPLSECKPLSDDVVDSNICTKMEADADGVVKSACFGDSGGPLVINGKTQIGVASFIIDDCESGLPNVYTSVSSYVDWINEKIA